MAKKRRKKVSKKKTKKKAKKKTTRKKAKRKATKKKTKKKTTRKKVKRKAPKKKAKKKTKSKRKPNAAFMKPLKPSSALAQVIGSAALPRTQAVKKIWTYIKKHKLQDSKNRRNINTDAKLRPVFKKDVVSMFELTKILSKHLS